MKSNLNAPCLLLAGTVLFSCLVVGLPIRAAETGQTPGTGAAPADVEVARAKLREKIKEAGAVSESKTSISSWIELRTAMNAARRVVDNTQATSGELEAATISVQQKMDALQERKVVADAQPRVALSASLFATNPKGAANNVALMWGATEPQDSFEIYRAAGKSGNFTKIYTGKGASFNDYNLAEGAYSYKVVASCGGKALTSNAAQIATVKLPDGIKDYSNQTGTGSATLWEPLKVGDTYYNFPGKRAGTTMSFIVQTSADGKTWKDGPVVLDQKSHADLDDFKFESGSLFYDKAHDQIVWWAHWERSKGYNDGRAFVATAKPGQPFTVHHIYNPLGIQVRDMSVFRDDDGQGYLVAASNVAGQGANATLTIFKLNADYTDVTAVTNKAMENEYREAPHIVKTDGYYYLFFSQATGWYPSRAGYVSARSLDGQWSEVRTIGNSSTFSAQSGGVLDYGQGQQHAPLLMANRWIRGEGTSPNSVLPLHFAEGFAFGDYAPTLLLDAAKGVCIPLQQGTLLSQDRPATSSIAGNADHGEDKAFDGDYATSFQSDDKKWPFSVTTDLGTLCKIRNVQISWHIHKGSEAYYKYTIEGSEDGQNWRTLLDRTDDKDTRVSKTYGFSSDLLPDSPMARHVRINVRNAVLHNNPNNWYPPTLYEVKIYGDKMQ